MPYNLVKFDGTALVAVADGEIDNQITTSINFIGKNVTDYGTAQNDNFLWLLENFAATTSPINPIQGQIWFDSSFASPSTGSLRPKIYDGGNWRTLGITEINPTQPTYLQPGDLWFDSNLKQLWVQTNTASNFSLIGPELVVGCNNTKWTSNSVLDSLNTSHAVVSIAVNGSIIAAASADAFTISASDPFYTAGFTQLHKGLTFVDSSVALYGNVEDSRYTKSTSTEIITGEWSFNEGINIGTGSISVDGSGNLMLFSGNGTVMLNASNILPPGINSSLGSTTATFKNIYGTNISAGASSASGLFIGNWALSNSSSFHPVSDSSNNLGLSNLRWGNVYASQVSAGSTASSATIEGQWSFTNNSKLTSPVLQTPTLTAGSPSTSGTLIGQWSAGPGSTIHATAVVDSLGGVQAPDVNPTPTTVALRDGIGNLNAVTFYGNLTGSIVTATNFYGGTFNGPVIGDVQAKTITSQIVYSDVDGSLRGATVTATNVYATLNGSLNSNSISAGSNSSPGTIIGKWNFTPDSQLGVNYISTGSGVNGTIVGQWRLASGSTFQATNLIDATGANVGTDVNPTNSTIAQRSGQGDLYANNFYGNVHGDVHGNLIGDAVTATNFYGTLHGSIAGGGSVAFATDADNLAFNGSYVKSTSSNVINTVVARDANGNFATNAITAVGAISTPNLLSGVANDSSAPGYITGKWTLTSGSTLQATYADLAEKYLPDNEYAPGSLLMFGGNAEVTLSNGAGNTQIAGIVSTKPAYMLNSELESGVYIALAGRVPCMVVGPISPGDLLVASYIPGVATSIQNIFGPTSYTLGSIIGRAIQGYSDPVIVGTIEVKVGM